MRMKPSAILYALMLLALIFAFGCGSDDDEPASDGDAETSDGDDPSDGDSPDGDTPDGDDPDGDSDGDEDEEMMPRHEGTDPPPMPADELGYEILPRDPVGTEPTPEEITAFTKKVTGFFKDTDYFNWVYRTAHGMHESYDAEMMPYKLWWQDTSMRKEGDTVIFSHHGRAENIAKRTIKVINNSIAAYLLTGDSRMAEVAIELMHGMVALSLGMEFEREDPIVKYLQSRAVFNHNHSYEVDGRKVSIDYDGSKEASFKWNVHVFEIPDNPTYGDIWISNMRSKDDVPYMFFTLPIATRAYYEAEDQDLKDAAQMYIEYMRGFAQSIVDNDWYILTKYEDGEAVIALDYTLENPMPADLGSFVHWEVLSGPDAECNAQLGAAMAAYGFDGGKGDCDGGNIGWTFEKAAWTNHFFNYNIYNYFHIAAMATAQFWGHSDIASSLMEGLKYRFNEIMYNPEMPSTEHKEFGSDLAGWLLHASTHGYPLTADEAQYIMKWYGDSSDWYRQWPHWDPWNSLAEGEEFSDYKAPRDRIVTDEAGNETKLSHIRLVEMPYIFEYCYSPFANQGGVQFIDCDIVADPAQWGED